MCYAFRRQRRSLHLRNLGLALTTVEGVPPLAVRRGSFHPAVSQRGELSNFAAEF
jgi:hypothetical protein